MTILRRDGHPRLLTSRDGPAPTRVGVWVWCSIRAASRRAEACLARAPYCRESRIGPHVPVSNLDDAISFYELKFGLPLFERGAEHP